MHHDALALLHASRLWSTPYSRVWTQMLRTQIHCHLPCSTYQAWCREDTLQLRYVMMLWRCCTHPSGRVRHICNLELKTIKNKDSVPPPEHNLLNIGQRRHTCQHGCDVVIWHYRVHPSCEVRPLCNVWAENDHKEDSPPPPVHNSLSIVQRGHTCQLGCVWCSTIVAHIQAEKCALLAMSERKTVRKEIHYHLLCWTC